MPYIVNANRECLRKIIDDVSYIGTTDNHTVTSVYKKLVEVFECFIPEKHDSFLNYIFTFILLKHKSFISNDFIQHVLKNEFLINPSYEKLERCVGLLTCMIAEFKRRKWNHSHPNSYIFLKHQLDFIIESYVGCYEQEKLEQNGDI